MNMFSGLKRSTGMDIEEALEREKAVSRLARTHAIATFINLVTTGARTMVDNGLPLTASALLDLMTGAAKKMQAEPDFVMLNPPERTF
jgi:hypothetical protein